MNSPRGLLQSLERDCSRFIVTGPSFQPKKGRELRMQKFPLFRASATAMPGTWKKPIRRLQKALVSPRVWDWLRRETVRYVLSWILALGTTIMCICLAWYAFDAPRRNDYRPRGGPARRPSGEPWGGNNGHAMIDFGGQWLMGRLLVEREGRQLYNRNVQRRILSTAYPPEDEDASPVCEGQSPRSSDAESLMFWLMGSDSRRAAETVA